MNSIVSSSEDYFQNKKSNTTVISNNINIEQKSAGSSKVTVVGTREESSNKKEHDNHENENEQKQKQQKEEVVNTSITSHTHTEHAEEEDDEEEEKNNVNFNPNSNKSRLKISWKCGMCGYHVLAMDQQGKPLPLSVSSFGEVLPMSCPRCLLEHTSWEQAIPFDEYGDHTNIRSKLSNNYVRAAVREETQEKNCFRPTPTSGAPGVYIDDNKIPPILKEIGQWSYKEGVLRSTKQEEVSQPSRGPRKSYYCGKCNRKLLRMDPYGELVPLVRDKDGNPLPIMCPGCKIEHTEWDVKPFTITK